MKSHCGTWSLILHFRHNCNFKMEIRNYYNLACDSDASSASLGYIFSVLKPVVARLLLHHPDVHFGRVLCRESSSSKVGHKVCDCVPWIIKRKFRNNHYYPDIRMHRAWRAPPRHRAGAWMRNCWFLFAQQMNRCCRSGVLANWNANRTVMQHRDARRVIFY